MAGQRFFWVPLVSSTEKTDHPDITEILLKVALNTITNNPNCILTKNYHILCDISDEHSVIDYSGLPSDNYEVHQASHSYEEDLHDVSKNMVRTIFVHTFHILLLLLINDFACGI